MFLLEFLQVLHSLRLEELVDAAEVLTHAAFYAGWPKAWAAFAMAKEVWADEVEPADGGYVIRDANSFNGVWVNNDSVEARALRPGDFIQIGTFCMQYEEN